MKRFRSLLVTAVFFSLLFTTNASGAGILKSGESAVTDRIESAIEEAAEKGTGIFGEAAEKGNGVFEEAAEKGNGTLEEALEKIRSPFSFIDDLEDTGIGKAVVFVRGLVDKQFKQYTDAVELMEEGRYDEAEELFSSLDGYRDSDTLLLQCEYEKGEKALSEERFDDALKIFRELGDYSDAPEKCLEARYGMALRQGSGGDYFPAIEAMEKLAGEGYAKAAEGLETIRGQAYAEAEKLYGRGQTEEALAIFRELKDYGRSEAYIALCAVKENLDVEYKGDSSVFQKAKTDMEPLLDDLDLADAAEAVVGNTVNAMTFLNGFWRDADRVRFFNCTSSGCLYNLPFVDGTGILSFENGSYMIENNGEKHALFRFKVLDRDTVEVMCFANGETYTLKRE